MKFIDNYKFHSDKTAFLIESSDESVDQEAWMRMRKSVSNVMSRYGFFANLLVKLKIQQHSNLKYKTMATDGYKIYYDPDFVKKLRMPEIDFVLCHEIMHNVAHHFIRTKKTYDPSDWNAACDYAINQLLKDFEGLKMPKDALYDPKYDGMSAEKIYNHPNFTKPGGSKWNMGDVTGNGELKGGVGGYGSGEESDDVQDGKPGEGEGEDGQGAGSPKPKPGEVAGGDFDSEMAEAEKRQSDGRLADRWEKLTSAASKSSGNGSAALDRFLKELREPQINWKSTLKRFIKKVMSKTVYKLPYKRFVHSGTYLPGPARDDNGSSNVVILIDTSASIGQEELDVFNSEIKKMMSSYTFENIYVVPVDDRVHETNVQMFKKSKDVNLKKVVGNGGTDFRPAFKWITQNIVKKNKPLGFVVYFTDMYGPAPSKNEVKYHKQVIWVLIDNEDTKVPFGAKLNIKRKDIIQK